ncbi:MAG TPA: hypothetical protein VLB81_13555 [Gaiellales bacterium]|nr:hypothetical protein [Gaiellales bacterium]
MGQPAGVPRGSRLVSSASALMGVLVAAAIGVGIYALVNPNHGSFGAPWPAMSEVLAACAALVLLVGIQDRRRGGGSALLVVGVLLALAALALLAMVAFALSITMD